MRGKQSHSQDVTEITRYCSPKTRQSVTGAVFVHLSAAYHTMNHRILITKIYQMTNDKAMTTLLSTLIKEQEEKSMGATAKWPPSRQCFSPIVV